MEFVNLQLLVNRQNEKKEIKKAFFLIKSIGN